MQNTTDKSLTDRDLVKLVLGPPGRMIAGSKSGYRKCFPKNLVVFNAKVSLDGLGQVWQGDLDLTRDEALLVRLAELADKELHVKNESFTAVYSVVRVQLALTGYVYCGEVRLDYSKDYVRHRRSGIVQARPKSKKGKNSKEQ
jgi:hypothetical protein